jgi:hypothetical protein
VGPHFERSAYRSAPDTQCAFVGPIPLFSTIEADLQRPHREFIEVVGRTRWGDPVAGSPHTKSHSEDLMAYARSFVATTTERFVSPDEIPSGAPLVEGAVCQVTVNAYERNPEARARCIARHGTACVICGFSFGAVYGPVAEGFIHVHHLRPLSEIGREYKVDPVEDLRPVCPNCHAVLHRREPPYSLDEVREFLRVHRG